MEDIFKFKTFNIRQKDNLIKVNQDGILLGTWIDVATDKQILDVGTGTGLIAIIVAERNVEAQIDAIEIDELACLEAQFNASQTGNQDRIQVCHQPIQDFSANSDKKYDHIVCNPPFFSGGGLLENSGEGFKHMSKLSHGELLLSVGRLLKPDGIFSVVLPFIDSLRFSELAAGHRLEIKNRCLVKEMESSPIQRVMISFVFQSSVTNSVETELILKDPDGSYSSEYQQLLKDLL